MEAILQLLVALLAVISEVTVHAAIFLFLLLMAIFSPKYRQKVRQEWETSSWRRFCIGLGVTLYSAALIIALLFWTAFLVKSPTEDVATNQDDSKTTITFTTEEIRQMDKTKNAEDFVDVAGKLIKRKLAERKDAEEQTGP